VEEISSEPVAVLHARKRNLDAAPFLDEKFILLSLLLGIIVVLKDVGSDNHDPINLLYAPVSKVAGDTRDIRVI
jgi:hypothetical protein